MKNWEEKYNEINPKIDNMIAEQASKMNEARRKQADLGKDVDSQEYKQAKADLKAAKTQKENLDKLKANLKKVSNYIAIRKQIEVRLNKYRKVRNVQNEIINNKRQIGKCEQQEKEATEELKDLTDKLRSGMLSKDEKIEVNKKITEAANKKQNAFNLRNQLDEKNISLGEGLKEFKYGEVDRDIIKEKMAEERKAIEILDSKCEELMNGEHVEYTYQQVMSQKEKSNELEQLETTEKTGSVEYEEIGSKSSFANRRPRLAKIGNFFKSVANKIFNRNKTPKLEEGKFPEKEETELYEKIEEMIEKHKKESTEEILEKDQIELTDKEMDRLVQDIIKDVDEVGKKSEKGIESLRDSIKVTLSEEGKARLAEFRKANGYRQGDTGPKMTEKGKEALRTLDKIAEEKDDGSR